MTKLMDKHWAVEVPDDAEPYILDCANGNGQGLFWTQPGVESPPWIILPPGSWQFLFTTKEATWEQAESVVEKINGWFKDYAGDVLYSDPGYSLQSLLVSKGCYIKKNYAIIQNL